MEDDHAVSAEGCVAPTVRRRRRDRRYCSKMASPHCKHVRKKPALGAWMACAVARPVDIGSDVDGATSGRANAARFCVGTGADDLRSPVA